MPRLLVLGGSQGAARLNAIVPAAVAEIIGALKIDIRHQCGDRHLKSTQAAYQSRNLQVEILPFIDDMAQAYGWADLVIGRAGAMTVCELAAAGAAAILVPFPYAVDDHQRANARVLVDVGAAVMMSEDKLTAELLGRTVKQLFLTRNRLLKLANAARSRAVPDAATRVADKCLETANA